MKNKLFMVFTMMFAAQAMQASDKDVLSLQQPGESLEDIQNEFGFDGIEPSSPRSTVLYGRQIASLYSLPSPSSRYVPKVRGSRSSIITTPRRASVASPFEAVHETEDEKSKYETLNVKVSPRNRLESLVHAITIGKFNDANDIIKNMAYEGKFSSSIAEAAGDALRSLSLSSPIIYQHISEKDEAQTQQRTTGLLRLQSAIYAGRIASPIVESAFKAGEVNKDRLYAKVDRIFKANR